MASTSEATRRHGASPERHLKNLEYLQLANAARSHHAEIKRLVATGQLTVADVLTDERAQGMKIGHLLCAQKGWGPDTAHHLLGHLFIWPTRQLRHLTDRQRQAIAEALRPTTETQ